MTDLAWFGFLAAIAIAALLAVWHEIAVAKTRRNCSFCGGRDGFHATTCTIHEYRRPAA